MKIDTTFYSRCIDTLDKAHELLKQTKPEQLEHDLYRSACIKEFEIILEQSGNLLRKVLKPYFHSSKVVDRLYFKDLFREAVRRGLMNMETCERWMEYRDNRNSTAHDYGVNYAEETLAMMPNFIEHARELADIINRESNAAKG